MSGCPPLAADPTGANADATIVLANQGSGAAVSEALLQMSPGSVPAAMARLGGITSACPHFTGVIGGFDTAFSSAALMLAPIGPQSTATRITAVLSIAGQTITVYQDVVVSVHANTIVVVIVSGTAPDTAATQQIAQRAYDKVVARW